LFDDGIVDEVRRQLKSGKEPSVYTVHCETEIRCTKLDKDMRSGST
jgi:RIO kinase 1